MKLLLLATALAGAEAFGGFGNTGDSTCGRGSMEAHVGETCAQSESFTSDDLVLEPILTYLAMTVPAEDSPCACDQAGVLLARALACQCPPPPPTPPPPSSFRLPLPHPFWGLASHTRDRERADDQFMCQLRKLPLADTAAISVLLAEESFLTVVYAIAANQCLLDMIQTGDAIQLLAGYPDALLLIVGALTALQGR